MPTIIKSPQISLTSVIRVNLLLSGNDNMVVDGYAASKEFIFDAYSSNDVIVTEVRFLITTDNIYFNGGSFFEQDVLSNGCKFEVRSEDVTVKLANFKKTEDFLQLPSLNTYDVITLTGLNDVFCVSYPLPNIKLVAGSNDFIKVTIRDTLNGGRIKYTFTATVFGEKV